MRGLLITRKFAVGAALLFFIHSSVVLAEVKTGLFVKYLQVSQGSSRAFMQFSTSENGSAGAYTFNTGCQYNHSLILDTGTLDGKNMYALLLSASVTKQPLEVNAGGTCTSGFPRLLEIAFGSYP